MSPERSWEATIEQLKWFLVFSLGEPKPEYAGSADEFEGMYAPSSIRALHEFAANWPCPGNTRDWPLFGGYWPQNQLLSPSDWTSHGDLTVFASENQGVCHWAFKGDDIADPSPLVLCDNEGWENSPGEPLADFLLAWCMNEVAIRHWIHGDERVRRAISDLAPELVVESSTFGTLTLYPNKVLTTVRYNEYTISVVGTEDVAVTLGDAAAPYRSVDVQFSFDRHRWRIELNEFGGGSLRLNDQRVDLNKALPSSLFDQLFDAALEEEPSGSALAHLTTSEPHAQITNSWGDTIRRKGYVADKLTDQLFRYLYTEEQLVDFIDNYSPFG